MGQKIYLFQPDQTLAPMEEQPYANEDLLQTLLEDYPDLLAGDQMSEENPRRWLLISREYGIPDAGDAAGRWSIDHLFVNQDGVPTLVEVKRSTDTRIRREVIGQMLDYAARVRRTDRKLVRAGRSEQWQPVSMRRRTADIVDS